MSTNKEDLMSCAKYLLTTFTVLVMTAVAIAATLPVFWLFGKWFEFWFGSMCK